MDPQTLELLRCLQSGPYDEPAWRHLRDLLRTQRRVLRAQQDLSTLTDIVQLLDVWAQTSESPRASAEVLREAADLAERDLSQPGLAADLRKRAVAQSHVEERPRAAPGNPHASLGKRRSDAGDLNGAIEAYERALNVEADMEVVYHLAELYAERAEPGDAQQAADLFFTLGDVLGHPAGLPMLQRALEQVPDHADALRLFTQYGGAPPEVGATVQVRPSAAALRARSQPKAARQPKTPARIPAGPPQPAEQAETVQLEQPAATAVRGSAVGLGPRPIAATDHPSAISNRMRSPIAIQALTSLDLPGSGGDASRKRQSTPGGFFSAPVVGPDADTRFGPAVGQTPSSAPGSISSFKGDPRKTTPGLAPAIVVNNPVPANPAHEVRQLRLADVIPSDSLMSPQQPISKPPPLRAAERRAMGSAAPGAAPVITIWQSAQPPAASFGPGARVSNAPLSSLSPVVVDDDAMERARARLSASRARKRRIVAATLATTAAAAIGLVLIAPRSLQDAQQLARGLFGSGSNETTTTSTARQPIAEPSQPTAAPVPVPPAPATPEGTTAAATPAPTPAPEPEPAKTEQAKPEEPKIEQTKTAAALTPTVRPLLDLANVRGGKLTTPQLTAALDKAAPKLDRCYEQALEKKPRLKGRLNVAWTVRPNGKVAAAKKQGGTIKDPELTRCTLDAIMGTRFPKPRKQATQIRVPFEYKKS
jgi:hypothetical protein